MYRLRNGWKFLTESRVDFAGRPLSDNPAVVCVGETMALLTPRSAGALDYAQDLTLTFGGAESNVAMYLAGHGANARWVSRLGDDALGHMILRQVASSGVDASGVILDSSGPTGVYIREVTTSGRRVHYYRNGSPASRLGPDALSLAQVATADVLHLTGITPALSDSCRAMVEAAVLHRSENDPVVTFDVNWRPSLWKQEPADLLLRLAQAAHGVFVGADEAAALWGCSDAAQIRALISEPAFLVVKDGGRGATVFRDGERVFVPSCEVNVVDVVGAGDAFAAGFIAGILRGLNLTEQAELGHRTAAAALRFIGDHGPHTTEAADAAATTQLRMGRTPSAALPSAHTNLALDEQG